jgi:hypothetical protein
MPSTTPHGELAKFATTHAKREGMTFEHTKCIQVSK